MSYKNDELREILLKRTKSFSLDLINLLSRFSQSLPNQIIIKQVIRSGTSIGANYREACEAESAKDFVHKIRISKKEAKETTYWLELLIDSNPKFSSELNKLMMEVVEFIKIFSSICSKFKN